MRRWLAVGALCVVAGIGNAQAATINFEDLALDPVGNGGDRTSGGFLFDTAANHAHVDEGTWGTANGSRFLVIDDIPGLNPVTFSSTAGAPFALTSIDISEAHTLAYSRQIQVTGNLVGGGTVSRLLTLDNNITGVTANYFETFAFNSTWTNLSSVVLQGIGAQCCGQLPGNYWAFDNVVVNVAAVPEPVTLSLLGLACASVAARRRRGRR